MQTDTDTDTKKPKKPKGPPQVAQADVPRILIPDSVSYAEAAEYCAKRATEEEQVAPFKQDFRGTFPWTGAYAVQNLLARTYSATMERSGEIRCETGRGEVTVRWGVWDIAGLGKLQLDVDFDFKRGFTFKVALHAKRKLRAKVDRFMDELRDEVAKRELYQGTALMLAPHSDGTIPITEPPSVLSIPTGITKGDVILSRELTDAVAAEVFLPITHADELRNAGLPTRRGVLLTGRPGTGKTLTARIAARLALDAGWTVFYLSDASGLPTALRMAAAHEPAVLIAEDIDRDLSGERDEFADEVLNALDGLDRSARVVFIATSNAPEDLPAALLRPGRLDSFLVFEAPDAHAAERLLKLYLGANLLEGETVPGEECAGLLSASVREVCARAILHARSRGEKRGVGRADLLAAARTVRAQQAFLEAAEMPKQESLPTLPIAIVSSRYGAGGKLDLSVIGTNTPADRDIALELATRSNGK